MYEKIWGNVDIDLYVVFLDLKKACDKVDRNLMWQILQIYGLVGELLRAVKTFYKESKACVSILVGRE